jgi:phage baseplate assembly protein W
MSGSVGLDALNVDFDRSTGETLVGWPAVAQNIREGFLTGLGTRIMREYYGSLVPQTLGRNISQDTMLGLTASIIAFLDVFEPRFRVTRAVPTHLTRGGVVGIEIRGEYMPLALLGDDTASGLRQVSVQLAGPDIGGVL